MLPVPVRLHGEPVKVPELSVVNWTVPVGVVKVPRELSRTVAVHDDVCATFTLAGAQASCVLLARRFTVIVALLELGL